MRPANKISTTWSANLAYLIGIIATDGNLSPDCRHINLTSKDEGLLLQIKHAFQLTNKIGVKARGGSIDKKYFVLQFGDIRFYKFLQQVGLTPAKSKTLKSLEIPKEFFADFLRGCIDGDGNISVAYHPASSKKQLRLRLATASKTFSDWILHQIRSQLHISGGWVYKNANKSAYLVSFGKKDSIQILKFMYYVDTVLCMDRKRKTALEFLLGE